MKNTKYIIILFAIIAASCKKNIDVLPDSNVYVTNYYSNFNEINVALTGCYNGLQNPLLFEWQMTELRSDNTVMAQVTSKSVPNRDLSDLDMFIPNTSHTAVFNYWLNTYNNVRNANLVLNSLGVNYKESDGTLSYDSISIPVTMVQRKKLAAEASFIRAYHYFNLVRLYGGVFLVHEPISPVIAKSINRSSVADIYKLIVADLMNAISNGNSLPFASIAAADLGRANAWSAKALLGKVYLNLNDKTNAAIVLQDIITNSGYKLLPNYADVFSLNNEMNAEILFAVRFKSGGLGLGSFFPNMFAPNRSGAAIVNGDGNGLNYPSLDIINLNTPLNTTGYSITDLRKNVSIGEYKPSGPGSIQYYPKKLVTPVSIVDDGEGDWTVIRYSDVVLMLAEAQGFSPASISLINQTRTRAGLASLLATTTNTTALFERELAKERRLEFAFENQRWFDLTRFNTTLTTITVEQTMRDHYAAMYPRFYSRYLAPTPTLLELQSFVTKPGRILLPIPQREIDNNTQIEIKQNPGY